MTMEAENQTLAQLGLDASKKKNSNDLKLL